MDPNTNNQPDSSSDASTEPVKVSQSMSHGNLGFTPPPASTEPVEPEVAQPVIISDVSITDPTPAVTASEPVAAPSVAPTITTVTDVVMPPAASSSTPPSQPLVSDTPAASSAPVNATVVSGDFGPTTGTPVFASSPAGGSGDKPKRKLVKTLIIALLAVLLIGGGSAAAYMGIIVPNKPINVLKKSLANSLQSSQTTFNGMLTGSPTSSGDGGAYKALFSGSLNRTSQAADFLTTVTYSGISLPVEARYVGGNVYFKFGDLSSISGLAKAYIPAADDAAYDNLVSKVSNQWFEVDSTLLNQAPESKCLTGPDGTITNDDLKSLSAAYDKNQFVTVTNSTGDTVNKQKVEKYNLSIDDDSFTSYINSLTSTSLYKRLQKCTGDTSTSSDKLKGDHQKTPLTVWVNKGQKQIVQVAAATTDADAKKDGMAVNFTTLLDNPKSPVNVAVPSGAQPVSTLYSDITAIYSSGLGTDSAGTDTTDTNAGDQSLNLTAGNAASGFDFTQLFKRL